MVLLRKAGAALCAVMALHTCAHAADAFSDKRQVRQTENSVREIEQAFARRHAVVDAANGVQVPLSSAQGLFPAYGFTPSEPGLSWDLSPLDDNVARLCIAKSVASVQDWGSAVRALQARGLSAASSTCQSGATWAQPSSWPGVVYGVKTLDRRDVLVRTLVPAFPVLTGVDAAAVTRPGLTLTANAGQTGAASVITVSNPLVYLKGDGSVCSVADLAVPELCSARTSGLVSVLTRPGFNVSHNCSTIPGGGSCSVSVSYTNQASERFKVGSLRLEFANGEVALIGLLGKRTPN